MAQSPRHHRVLGRRHAPLQSRRSGTNQRGAGPQSHRVLHPQVQTTPKQLKLELDDVFILVSLCIEEHLIAQRAAQTTDKPVVYRVRKPVVELMIIDESERLSAGCIEHLRDRFDRYGIALLLIGMTGLEKQFSHYAQFYSRVGFAHQYRALADDELLFVLQRHWKRLARHWTPTISPTTKQSQPSTESHGKLPATDRLFTQIDRVLRINDLDTITEDVIEAARSTLCHRDARVTKSHQIWSQQAQTFTRIPCQRAHRLRSICNINRSF